VFADVRDQLHQGPSALKSDGRDRAIVGALQQDIRASQAADHPWFGFVFLDSTHAPYHMPEGYPPVATPMAADIDFLKFGPEHDPTPELNRYRTAVHYADSLIGSLLDDLRAQGLAAFDAAAAGALLHALAGDRAAADGARGLLPTDLLAPLRRLANPALSP
ncbi:sulfatase-like hydrolase/transferase, partial [Mesorhizobium sp. M8A.F.Ca.ET.142.01.1.1]|uniref:sulfatase-like hydrolase/transferase n=1 Tax=Mesorhizobium sp. M8A.F.Ca.ET.142.01.1.1 TaxID=2563958 RepID=UPI001AEE1725